MENTILNEYIDKALIGKSPTTVKTYQSAVHRFEEWLQRVGTDLTDYARSDVQQYMDYLVIQKKSANSMNTIWAAIKHFSKWSGKRDAIEDIRVVKPENFKKIAPKALDKVERNRILRDVDRAGNKRNIAIIVTLLYTGLRVSELISLDRSDVQISDRKGELRVIGKGNKERTIPLDVEVRRALSHYLEERQDHHPALFLSNRQERISVRAVQDLLNKYGAHPHQLRHTFITALVRSGEDFAVIQSLSGHESADMVLRYSQPTEADREKAIESMYKD